MKDNNKIVGAKLKQARVEAGITQHQLSIYLDIDQSMISKVEKGDRSMDQDTLLKVSELFCLPLEYFNNDDIEIYDRAVSFRTDNLSEDDLDFVITINRIVLNQIKMDEMSQEII